MKLKLKKCSFIKTETKHLGFVITSSGVKTDPQKIEVIKKLPSPTNEREVRSFIGMCSFYRRFVSNFSGIAEPIIALTRKYAKFKWTPACERAFKFLKENLTVVLTYFPVS